VLAHLRPMLNDIEEAFKIAIPEASSFFRDRREPVERMLFAAIVRWEVKRALRRYEVSDEATTRSIDYELDDVSNIGLIISCEGFQIRILKAREARVPTSGSTVRAEFYQHNLLYESGAFLDIAPRILNLVVLWETDYVATAALSVACPKREVVGIAEGRRTVECYWQQPITQPVVALPEVPQVERLEIIGSELDEVTLLEDAMEHTQEAEQEARSSVRAIGAASSNLSEIYKGKE